MRRGHEGTLRCLSLDPDAKLGNLPSHRAEVWSSISMRIIDTDNLLQHPADFKKLISNGLYVVLGNYSGRSEFSLLVP